jgi:Ca2+/H+ antiporter, TMEM165/GDT1 family
MPSLWTHVGPTALAAFLASLVEAVEALTVILAVGTMRGWRDALLGSLAALLVLGGIVAALGSALTAIPLQALQLFTGALLLLFGLRWLRKAILRAAGILPLHDEALAFQKERQRLTGVAAAAAWDKIAFATSFQITMLEGAEVVFIVLAVGAGDPTLLRAAGLGALASLLLVIMAGAALHRPLARVPENQLKFLVGVLLSAFGTFWFGEGVGLAWPSADWSLIALIALYLTVALAAVRACLSKRVEIVA